MKSWTEPQNLSKLWTFLWVGALNTLIGYSIFALALKVVGLQYNFALFVAYAIGILIGYRNHRHVTFKSKAKHRAAFTKFVITYALVYGVNALLLTGFIELAHISPLIAQIISLVIVTLMSFIVQRTWVFKHD